MSDIDQLESCIADLESKLRPLQNECQPGSIRWYIKWYQDRYPSRRYAFRVAGLLTLGLAFLAPFLAGAGADSKTLIAGLLTLLASLTTFFSLKQAWAGYYLGQLNLIHAVEAYELELLAARRMVVESSETMPEAIKLVHDATQTLMSEANKTINEETKGFFADMKFPAAKLSGK